MPGSDDDITRAFAGSDPAQTLLDAPLSLRAEADLARIVHGDPRSAPAPRRTSRRWIGISAIAVVLAGVFIVSQVVGPHRAGDAPAHAATPPLLHGTGQLVSWTDAVNAAKAGAGKTATAEPTRGASYSAWFLDTSVDSRGSGARSYVSPQEVTFNWKADLSGRLRIVAGMPLTNVASGVAQNADAPKPGSVISDDSHAPGRVGVIFPTAPPGTGDAMADYLATGAGTSDRNDPVQVLDSVQLLLDEWRVAGASHSALLDVLGALPALKPMGTVTDRLGREGVGFTATSANDPRFEDLLVLGTVSGSVLSIEKIFVGGHAPEYANLTPPAVTTYVAWKK
jgi:predicted secreted protein